MHDAYPQTSGPDPPRGAPAADEFWFPGGVYLVETATKEATMRTTTRCDEIIALIDRCLADADVPTAPGHHTASMRTCVREGRRLDPAR
jgi:hypothetical protein